MTYTVDATPTSVNPTHHASLTDGTTTVGLVFCDANGEPSERAIRATPYPRQAMKTSQGQSKYSDLEPPYFAIPQDDWSGGRAAESLADDTSRYFDGGRIGATSRGLILGGLETYITGYRSQDMNLTGSMTFTSLLGAQKYMARSFVASATYSADKAEMWIRRVGAPTDTLSVQLHADNAGVPGTFLIGVTIAAGAITDTLSILYAFDWTGTQSLTSGVTYWIVIYDTGTPDASNYWAIGVNMATGGKISADGSSWSTVTWAPYFRVTDADAPFIARFYEYKEGMYFATQPDNNTAGKVYRIGYVGNGTVLTASPTVLTDASQSWTTDELAGAVIKLVSNAGLDMQQNWRVIASNTATAITVSPAWDAPANFYCEYVVYNLNKCTELTGTGLAYPVVDVKAANNIVYLCQGEKANARKHNHVPATDTGTGLAEQWGDAGFKAHFLEVLHDPLYGQILYLGRNERDYDFNCEVYESNAPISWNDVNLWGPVRLHNMSSAWDEQAVTNVTSTFTNGRVKLQIKTGIMQTVSVTAGGSSYVVGNVLTVVETGATGGTVTVATIGGGGDVLTVTLTTGGTGYSAAAGKATTGGAGTGCTINVSAITGFTTGVVASEAIASKDLRYCNKVRLCLFSDVPMDAGDLQLLLDNSANCASPVFSIDLPSIPVNDPQFYTVSFDPNGITGADAIISVGLNLVNSKASTDINGVTTIQLIKYVEAIKDNEAIDISANGDRITGLALYDDPRTVWILTETGMGPIKNHQYLPVPLDELATVRSDKNGRAHCVNDVYLYISLQNGVEKYFRQNLDDVGPNRDTGMPSNRQGPIVDMASYAGKIFAAVDGGTSNYSSVLELSGNAWHEVYRAPRVGLRIRKLHIQNIPGSATARLWISMGADVLWVPISMNPYYDADYRFTHEAHLISGYIDAGMLDVKKLFKSLKLFCEGVGASQYVQADYRLDGDTAWTQISGTFDTVPVEDLDFSSASPPTSSARRIQVRLRLYSTSNTATPRVKSAVVEGIGFVPVKYQYTGTALMAEGEQDLDLEGEEDTSFANVETKFSKLKDWANTGQALTWRCVYSPYDNKTVFIDPVSLQPLEVIADDQSEKHIFQVTAIEA